tara:strand:+ start:6255 stop:7235 length:981 start_codon:yes stop_codon:yes gene_type:complete
LDFVLDLVLDLSMNLPINVSECHRFCFSGGGMNGIQFIGSLVFLQDIIDFRSYTRQVTDFFGTSVGSLCALLCYLRADFQSVKTLQLVNSFVDVVGNFDQVPLLNGRLYFHGGIHSGKHVITFLITTIHDLCGLYNPRFCDLNRLFPLDKLLVVATDVDGCCEKIFSTDQTPNIFVADAIFASMCLPFYFREFKIENQTYIDGGLMNNIPFCVDLVELFHSNLNTKQCLIFKIESHPPSTKGPLPEHHQQLTSLSSFLWAIISGSTQLFIFQKSMCKVINEVRPTLFFYTITFPSLEHAFAFNKQAVCRLLNSGENIIKNSVKEIN